MSSQKKQAIVDPTSVEKGKATWDPKLTEYFIQACVEQVNKGERNGTTLTKKGWRAVLAQFNSLSGRNYDRMQLKNKWDNLKKEWQAWHKLFGNEIGLRWDTVKNTVDAPDEWWEKKQLENPLYGKFRYKGLPFAPQLTTLFKDVVTTGSHAWAPSSGTLPSSSNDDDDDEYRPCLDNVPIDTEECSGDNEEASAEPTDEMRNINLNNSQGTVSEKSGEKRKRDKSSERKGKAKALAASRIADAISSMADTCRSRNEISTRTSISEVMAELHKMPEVTKDSEFFARCCNLLFSKSAREMFVANIGFKDRLLTWLRYAAYNPPKE